MRIPINRVYSSQKAMTFESTYRTECTILDSFTLSGEETIECRDNNLERPFATIYPTSMVGYTDQTNSTTKEMSYRASSYVFWARFSKCGMNFFPYTDFDACEAKRSSRRDEVQRIQSAIGADAGN